MRQARNEIEREGVHRGHEELGRADVAVLVFDGSEPLQRDDMFFIKRNMPQRIVVAVNKSDLKQAVTLEEIAGKTGLEPIAVSAEKETGIETLEREILHAAYGTLPPKGAPVIFTSRQAKHITQALNAARTRDTELFVACINRAANINPHSAESQL
jgi:tRNA modification GTPase